jgi:1-deoxy-D-xylulose-5-phosphate reductoisomerase
LQSRNENGHSGESAIRPDKRIQNVTVLGSTGSIGDNTIDVVERHPDRFRLFALSGRSRLDKLFEQCRRYQPSYAVVGDAEAARKLTARLKEAGGATRVLHGEEALAEVAGSPQVDIVVTGIVGAAGLLPTLAAVSGRRRVLIANKEPLVMMGATILERAKQHGATVIPLDSEHNAIFQCLPSGSVDVAGAREVGVRRILLTASGGPFRGYSREMLDNVTPEQAVAHPNWTMGRKISVDSATLMNKGLELIEACALFSLDADDVMVVIHPQSTIHSMVEYIDGSVIAQMGSPDMRIPIAHGLGWPHRIESGADPLDFYTMHQLQFERPDEKLFPCLRLAREAASASGSTPVILNAANEVAVESFLMERLSFVDIPVVIEETLARVTAGDDLSLEAVLESDSRAREVARQLTDRLIS